MSKGYEIEHLERQVRELDTEVANLECRLSEMTHAAASAAATAEQALRRLQAAEEVIKAFVAAAAKYELKMALS